MSLFSLSVIIFSLLYPGLTTILAVAAPIIRDVDIQNPAHVRNVSIVVGSIGFSDASHFIFPPNHTNRHPVLFVVSIIAFLRVTAQTRPMRHSLAIHLPPYHTNATPTRTVRAHTVSLRAHPDPSSSALFEPSVAVEVEAVKLAPLRAAHMADQVRRHVYDASSGSESSVEVALKVKAPKCVAS